MNLFVAGWVSERADYERTWDGCIPAEGDAGAKAAEGGRLPRLRCWEGVASCFALPRLARRRRRCLADCPAPCPAPSDSFTLVWESKVLLHLQGALGNLLTMQASLQGACCASWVCAEGSRGRGHRRLPAQWGRQPAAQCSAAPDPPCPLPACSVQAAGQSLNLATHSFLYAGAGLVAALGPTVLVGTASGLLISNAWAVASERAVKAGERCMRGRAVSIACALCLCLARMRMRPLG